MIAFWVFIVDLLTFFNNVLLLIFKALV